MKIKLLIYLCAVLIFISCKESKNSQSQTLEKGFVNGIISTKYKDQGCPYLIEVIEDNETKVLHPIELDNSYKADGKTITFKYRKIRAPQNDGCNIGLFIKIDQYQK